MGERCPRCPQGSLIEREGQPTLICNTCGARVPKEEVKKEEEKQEQETSEEEIEQGLPSEEESEEEDLGRGES